MKIYQIHRHVNKENVLMASYSDKSKAENEKKRLETICEELSYDEYLRCDGCPFIRPNRNGIEEVKLKYPNYCKYFEPRANDDPHWRSCKNELFCYYKDELFFTIEEVEVEE